jgi:O-antigen/teichoic acid export membrane protein
MAYADWAQLMATAVLISLGEMGINIYFGNAWQAAFARKDGDGFARVLAVAGCIYGVLVAFLMSIVAGGIAVADPARALGLRSIDTTTSRVVLGLLCCAVVLKVGRGLLSQIYRGRGEFARGIMLDSLASAVLLGVTITCALLGAGVTTLAGCYLAAEIGGGWLVMGADIKRRYPGLSFRPTWPTRAEVVDLVSNLKWLALLQGTPILWLNLPVLLLGGLSTSANDIVSFVLMRTMVNFARTLISTLSLATGVELAAASHAGDVQVVQRNLVAAGVMGSVAAAVLCCALYTFLTPMMHLWSGHRGLEVPAVLAWLGVGLLAAAPAMPLVSLAILGGSPRAVGIASIAQLVLGFGLGWAGGQIWGLPGLAAGLAIGEILAQIFVLRATMPPVEGLVWYPHVVTCLIRATLAGAWALVVGEAVIPLIGSGTMLELSSAGMLWGIVGAVPAMLLGLDRSTSLRLWAAMRGKSLAT